MQAPNSPTLYSHIKQVTDSQLSPVSRNGKGDCVTTLLSLSNIIVLGKKACVEMSSGNGLFSRRSSATPIIPRTQASSSSPAVPTTSNNDDAAGPRRRHGSAPLATAFGLMRRESVPTTASRRSLILAPRKMSEPGITHQPSPLSPKRKPLPAGSAFDKQTSSSQGDDGGGGKLSKMELTGGSTMVLAKFFVWSDG